jgi:hypothetical protein
MDLGGSIGEERAQGSLVQCGQDDTGYGQADGDPFDEPFGHGPMDPFKKGLRHFHHLDSEIYGDVPAHQEEHGGRTPRNDHWVRQAPRLPQVHHKIDDREEISQQTVEQGESFYGFEILASEKLHRGPQEESGSGQGDHYKEAEPEEQSPWVIVG